MSDKIISEVKDYINNVIRPSREEFGGMPTCPFAGPELDSGRLMIDVVVPDEVPLPDLITKFLKSDNNSALFAQLTDQEFSPHDTGMYERFINVLLNRFKSSLTDETISDIPLGRAEVRFGISPLTSPGSWAATLN